jgi:hypothetical protein
MHCAGDVTFREALRLAAVDPRADVEHDDLAVVLVGREPLRRDQGIGGESGAGQSNRDSGGCDQTADE